MEGHGTGNRRRMVMQTATADAVDVQQNWHDSGSFNNSNST